MLLLYHFPLVVNIAVALGSHNHIIVTNFRELGGFWRQVIVLEYHGKDGFNLHVGKHLSHAGMHASTESKVGKWLLVFFTRFSKTIGIKLVGILECTFQAHRDGGRNSYQISLGNGESGPIDRDIGVLHAFA